MAHLEVNKEEGVELIILSRRLSSPITAAPVLTFKCLSSEGLVQEQQSSSLILQVGLPGSTKSLLSTPVIAFQLFSKI